jgi:two-component sensor histidine kinase
VQLLALVHQRIYASGQVRELRLDELVAEIARNLLQSRGAAAKDVALALDLGSARMDADRAVPLAFLVGEAVSIALDALQVAGAAELSLSLKQDEDGEIRFAIDAPFRGETARDLGPGPRLIDAFAGQLGASVARAPQSPYPLWLRVPPQSA